MEYQIRWYPTMIGPYQESPSLSDDDIAGITDVGSSGIRLIWWKNSWIKENEFIGSRSAKTLKRYKNNINETEENMDED